MDMSGSNMNMTMMSQMAMVFFNSHTTPIWSAQWQPTTSGQYAGTCIFLIIFSVIFRSLLAGKHILEARWADQAWKRRYITVAENSAFSEQLKGDPNSMRGVLTANGVDENVAILMKASHGPQPWRFSVDVPRAFLSMILVGVGYLLMLAVMTLNIGYYFSVLAGAFIGELAVGRFHRVLEEHH